MKQLMFYGSLICALGPMSCQSMLNIKYQTLRESDAQGKIFFDGQRGKKCNPKRDYANDRDAQDYCLPYNIVPISKLLKIATNDNVPIAHNGTSNNYHFFGIWEKIGSDDQHGEIFLFAVRESDCKLIADAAPDAITKLTGQTDADRKYATLLNSSGRCVVFK